MSGIDPSLPHGPVAKPKKVSVLKHYRNSKHSIKKQKRATKEIYEHILAHKVGNYLDKKKKLTPFELNKLKAASQRDASFSYHEGWFRRHYLANVKDYPIIAKKQGVKALRKIKK